MEVRKSGGGGVGCVVVWGGGECRGSEEDEYGKGGNNVKRGKVRWRGEERAAGGSWWLSSNALPLATPSLRYRGQYARATYV